MRETSNFTSDSAETTGLFGEGEDFSGEGDNDGDTGEGRLLSFPEPSLLSTLILSLIALSRLLKSSLTPERDAAIPVPVDRGNHVVNHSSRNTVLQMMFFIILPTTARPPPIWAKGRLGAGLSLETSLQS